MTTATPVIVSRKQDIATQSVIPGLTRGGKDASIVWEVNDRFGRARAVRINTPEGNPTKFAMVYSHDTKSDKWTAIRPVSDRYTPLPTAAVVDEALVALNGEADKGTGSEIARYDRAGTLMEISLRTNNKIEIGRGKPFDLGHPWSRDINHVHGTTPDRDVITPTFRVRNAYDATSSIIFDIGIFRLICENGAKIMLAGYSIKAIHTLHEVSRVVAAVKDSGKLRLDETMLKRLPSAIVDKDAGKQIVEALPDKWQKPMIEYVGLDRGSAWAYLNGLSYLQTHEYTLSRGRQLNKLVGQTFAAAGLN